MFCGKGLRYIGSITIILAICICIVGCSKGEALKQKKIKVETNPEDKEVGALQELQPTVELQVTPARWSTNTKIAVAMPVLDFADDNILIMHDYFGLFIYNLDTNEIEDSIDLQVLGYDFSDDSSRGILVSPKGDKIWIYSILSKSPYEYDRMSRTLIIANEGSDKSVFEDLVSTKDISSEKLSVKSYRCSKESVLFSDGSYGTLYVKNNRITGISYIRNGEEWELFRNQNCTMPELLRQDDFFYEQFAIEGSKSASLLMFFYCTMINDSEYAGICSLSDGMADSEELQKEWGALRLTASSEEIKTTMDQACFKVYIISSASSTDSGLLQGMNEKYVYLKKGHDGWHVEGFWHDTIPAKNWWG